MDGEAAFRPGGRLESAAEHGDALLHPDEPVPAVAVRGGDAGAVVDDLELEPAQTAPDADVRLSGAGVLEDVRERLLHDPVRREVERARQRSGIARDIERHGQAGSTNGGDELVDVRQPTLWVGRLVAMRARSTTTAARAWASRSTSSRSACASSADA